MMKFKEYFEPDRNKWGGERADIVLPQYKFVYLKRKCEYWKEKTN